MDMILLLSILYSITRLFSLISYIQLGSGTPLSNTPLATTPPSHIPLAAALLKFRHAVSKF